AHAATRLRPTVRRGRASPAAIPALLDMAELALLERGPRPCPASRSAAGAGHRRPVGTGLAPLADRTASLATAPLLAASRPDRPARLLAGCQGGVGGGRGTGANARSPAPR